MNHKYMLVGLVALLSTMILDGAATADDNASKSVKVSVFGDGDLTVPAAFKKVPPKSGLVEHEFQASVGEGKEDETARVTMMAAGGDVKANIDRWKLQLVGGDAKDQKTEEMKIGDWQVYVVDLTGTYADRMGGGPFSGGKVIARENYAMAGAILVNPDGQKYFVKMIGPKEVVKANRKAFVEMIKTIGK